MRYGIIADIHSNLKAFEAVLADMESRGTISELWCLGDTVGYGPQPHECIELLRKYNHISVAGNHDWAATGQLDFSHFTTDAADAIRWTAGRMSPKDIDFLSNLPMSLEKVSFTLVHGSPRAPLREYLTSVHLAEQNLEHMKTPFCLIGHSHLPLVITFDEGGAASFSDLKPGVPVELGQGHLILNPGSVGQPRDNDPRASYAIYDSESAMFQNFRVQYDIRATQGKMAKAGLPERLITRLSYGA